MTPMQNNLDLEKNAITTSTQTPTPLSVHVRQAVDHYFAQLNGHDAHGLYAMVIAEVEKPLIETTLAYSGFNQSRAAKALGLSRSTLRKKMALYKIQS